MWVQCKGRNEPARPAIRPNGGQAPALLGMALERGTPFGAVWLRRGELCYPELVRPDESPRFGCYLSGRSAAWLARLVRDQEAGGSNPLAPTNLSYDLSMPSGFSLASP
jgi:hypothetical protein